jgi:hypothetical protein
MFNLFIYFRKGIFWVILGVLIVAVSLTAQAPKSPTTSQATSEIGRYVFWSTPVAGGTYKWGFLDTKRGRVWVGKEELDEWEYDDLNNLAISIFTRKMLGIVSDTADSELTESARRVLELFKKEIKEKEE